jgi:hypothetical protein
LQDEVNAFAEGKRPFSEHFQLGARLGCEQSDSLAAEFAPRSVT